MEKPSLVEAKILTKSLLTDDVVRLKIKNLNPLEINFKPGQFINLKIEENTYRSYSIFKYDKNINAIEIAAKVSHSGPGANYIKSLGPGDDIEYIGPSGKFILKNEAKEVYLFATGTGITPFISYFYFLEESLAKPEVHMYWGLHKKEDVFFDELIYGFSKSIPKFEYKIFLSQEKAPHHYEKGRITQVVGDLNFGANSEFYLCGNPNMVDDVNKLLAKKGVTKDKVFFEKYTFADDSDDS